jgi:imidazoleglycerol-phosphate dehydratase
MDKRVKFDFEIEFSNGGGLQGQDFRLDIPGDDISDAELARRLVDDLRLLMVGAVRIMNKTIIEEAHKRRTAARRTATVHRQTQETDIRLTLGLDGTGRHAISTGVGFLDHMLTHVAVHGLFDVEVQASGDLHIDAHHTIEDTALALGQALAEALGDKAGIARMGSAYVAMDEALALVVVDLSGRPYAVVEAMWQTPAIGQFPTALVTHFIESLAVTARANIHARVLAGRDDHHQAEALFKALGRALDAATRLDERRAGSVPSTKGVL